MLPVELKCRLWALNSVSLGSSCTVTTISSFFFSIENNYWFLGEGWGDFCNTRFYSSQRSKENLLFLVDVSASECTWTVKTSRCGYKSQVGIRVFHLIFQDNSLSVEKSENGQKFCNSFYPKRLHNESQKFCRWVFLIVCISIECKYNAFHRWLNLISLSKIFITFLTTFKNHALELLRRSSG